MYIDNSGTGTVFVVNATFLSRAEVTPHFNAALCLGSVNFCYKTRMKDKS